MKKLISATFLSIILSVGAFSQIIDNDDFIMTHGPYLQNIDFSGVTVIWTTNKPAVPGVVLTGPDGGSRFIRNSSDGIIDGGGLLHKVRIEGLEAGKTYKYSTSSVQILKYQAYRIYFGDTLSGKTVSFTIPSGKSEKTSFTVINDVHENSGKMASYLKNRSSQNSDLIFFNGDMVDYLQNTDQLFPGFIDTAVTYFASSIPFYLTRGNHETRGFVARELKDYFDFKNDRYYFSFDNGPVHFVVLDCGEDKPDNNRYYYGMADFDLYRLEELNWLKKEVQSDAFRGARYRIVIIHMPVIKQERQGHGMRFLADNFGPVLEGTGVNLMISAHTHRNTYYEAGKSGFGYPVLVNSNNSFVEVEADSRNIKAIVKDVTGSKVAEYIIK